MTGLVDNVHNPRKGRCDTVSGVYQGYHGVTYKCAGLDRVVDVPTRRSRPWGFLSLTCVLRPRPPSGRGFRLGVTCRFWDFD